MVIIGRWNVSLQTSRRYDAIVMPFGDLRVKLLCNGGLRGVCDRGHTEMFHSFCIAKALYMMLR